MCKKYISLFIALALAVTMQGQVEVYTKSYWDSEDSLQQAKLDSVCAIRGHVYGDYITVTSVYYAPWVIDLDSVTYRIMWDRNTLEYRCARCSNIVRQPVQARPDTAIVWDIRKKPK